MYQTILNNIAFIKVNGKDARDFLQGQISNDISLLQQQKLIRACICNLKGRILTLLDIFIINDVYILALPQELQQKIIHNLQHYAKFSQIEIKSTTEFMAVAYYLSLIHI